MIKYVFRDSVVPLRNAQKIDPQKIGEELDKIAAANAGILTPDLIWQHAREKPRGALHKHFQWDQELAAQAHWRDQARQLVQVIRLVPSEGAEPERVWVSISDGKNGTSYRRVAEIREDRELSLLVMLQAEIDLRAWEERYRELSEICDLIKTAREALSEKLRRHRGATSDESHVGPGGP